MKANAKRPLIKVWDPVVRISHWGIASGFLVAYLTEDELLTLHLWAGYLVGILAAIRVVWGLVGPEPARFGSFVYAPGAIGRYLIDLVEFRAKRYVGHSPGGGLMIVALLALLGLAVASGQLVYSLAYDRGPASSAHLGAHPLPSERAGPASDEEAHSSGTTRKEDLPWDELHEAIVNLTLLLVVLHVLAVLLVSMLHNENLIKSMITGMKAPGEED